MLTLRLNDSSFNETAVGGLKDVMSNQWSYICKVYGVDVEKDEEVESFLKNDENPQHFKEHFQQEVKIYVNLKQQVREASIATKVLESMRRKCICSVGEAEDALEFVKDIVEIILADTKENEPSAINSIKELENTNRCLTGMDIFENIRVESHNTVFGSMEE